MTYVWRHDPTPLAAVRRRSESEESAYDKGRCTMTGSSVAQLPGRRRGVPLPEPAQGCNSVLPRRMPRRNSRERDIAHAELCLRNQALESTATSVVIMDNSCNIIWANKAFSDMTGYAIDELEGKNPCFLRSSASKEELYHELNLQ